MSVDRIPPFPEPPGGAEPTTQQLSETATAEFANPDSVAARDLAVGKSSGDLGGPGSRVRQYEFILHLGRHRSSRPETGQYHAGQ